MIELYILSIFYLILISIVFFSKKRINNIDNKLYTYMLLTNVACLCLDILQSIFIHYRSPLYIFFSKMFLVSILSWVFIFTIYSMNVGDKNKYHNKFLKIMYLIYGVLALLIIITHIDYQYISINKMYTTSTSVLLTKISMAFFIIIMLTNAFKNLHNATDVKIKQKCIPIIFFSILGGIIFIVQMINPYLVIASIGITFGTILTFFFIENPDVKMLEEVSIAKEQAEKANNAKSDFLSNMSHEIRTPLNAIVGFSESLKEDNLSEDSKNKVDDIITASNNLLEIVNGILDISKIEANKLEIINKEYDIHSMLDELVSLTKARIGTKELNFKVSIDQALPSVLYGDNTRLKQIILNLLTNAVKYTKEGSIFFTVSTVVKDNICRLIISVEDTGIGMKEESLQKLFTKFERLNVEKQITIEGTGLGLAITKKLVDLMNGKIIVQSVYGKGSKFTVSIDQRIISVERPLAKQPAKSESKVIDANGAKILLVDDNELNIKVASTLLKKYNFVIESCTSAFACIAKIKDKNEYDIILMDDMMPKMTGKEAVKVLKNEMNYKKPVIVLTANAITGMREEYLAAGFDDYLSKPIEKKELERVIKEHIHKTNSTSINTPSSLSTNSIIINKIDLEMPVLSKPQIVETQPINSEYSGKKVLLVDDNELNIKVALTVLKKYNLDITTVMSGSECIEKTIDNKYDLILLDDMMPELDGCTTLDNLKTLDNFNTPVVMMTASSKDEVQNKIIEHGFDGYLSKPFKKEDLDEILKTLLN